VEFPLTVGSAWDLPIQLVSLLGPPGPLSPADTLTGTIYAHAVPGAAVVTPSMSYLGVDRVVASWGDAAATAIQPSTRYVLAVWWAPASTPSRSQLVARVPIVGKAVAP
jgi:hypothetical protein